MSSQRLPPRLDRNARLLGLEAQGRLLGAHVAVSYTHLTLPTNREV